MRWLIDWKALPTDVVFDARILFQIRETLDMQITPLSLLRAGANFVGDGDVTFAMLREFCVIESCIVMHCGADQATGATQAFFYNNKLQFSDPTTNRAVGGSSFFEAQQRFDDIGSVSCMACKQTEF